MQSNIIRLRKVITTAIERIPQESGCDAPGAGENKGPVAMKSIEWQENGVKI